MEGTGSELLIGRVLDGRYQIEARIAVGGMATVYRALDTRLDRAVALKVMHAGLAADPGFVERFIREAKAVARLDHPNVVRVFDQGTDAAEVFLAMEYVPGCTLREVLRERGALHPRAALDILEPVLAALGAAHRCGLVHRDVKPENVLLGDDGRVKVADFGLVQAVDTHSTSTPAGSVLGTVSYLAPEQIEHGSVTARSDVYACGVLLYEMLTGSKPHDGGTPVQVIYQHLHEDVPAPSLVVPGLAAELDALVASATARAPRQRPLDAVRFLSALQAARRQLTAEQLDLEPPAARAGRRDPSTPAGVPARKTSGTAVLADDEATVRSTTAVGRRSSRPDSGAPALPLEGSADASSATTRWALPPELTHRQSEPASFPARLRGSVGRGLLAVAACLGVLAALGALVWFVGFARYTSTPSVVGATRTEAELRLANAGLDARFTGEFSESVPADKVISTDPAPGERLRNGGPVHVVLSRGPERTAVPRVTGTSQAAAEQTIKDSGLTVVGQRSQFSDTVAKGSVITTEPRPGVRVKPKTGVRLVVSKGAPVPVPDVVGMSLDDAQEALSRQGLELRASTEKVYSDEVADGSVAEQTPRAGGVTSAGGTVTVAISKGPELFDVPDVDGLVKDKARSVLEDAGFSVDVVDVLPLFGDNQVFRQTPGAHHKAPKGSTVTLWVR